MSSRGFLDTFVSHNRVKTDTLRDNLESLLGKLNGVMSSLPAEIGQYDLTEMTLAQLPDLARQSCFVSDG